MDNKNVKKLRAEKARAEEEALNRILCWVAGGAVLEFILMLLNRYWNAYIVGLSQLQAALDVGIRIMAVAGLACAAGALFWWSNARKIGRSANLPGTVCLFMAGLSVCCFAGWLFSNTGLRLMCIVVPVVIVLALVYYLYQHEFFLLACQSALTLLGIWICGRGLRGNRSILCYAYVGGAAVLVLLGALLCRKAQGGEGMLEWKGESRRLFARDANYALLYAGAVIALVTLVVAAIGISSMALYAVAVAWLLIMAVYYTVKLM